MARAFASFRCRMAIEETAPGSATNAYQAAIVNAALSRDGKPSEATIVFEA